jgi:methionyl-tRNA synthetase
VWGLDFLERYDPDALRYYLTANMPEGKDTDWDWQDFFHRNNSELVATWGNLANRVLAFAYKNWDGYVPTPGAPRPDDLEILAVVENGFQSVGEHLEAVRLRAALFEALRLATEVNKYLDKAAPWFEIKTDKSAAATTIFTALKVIDSLKVLFAPFLPFSSERLHQFFGYTQPLFGVQFTQTIFDSLGEHVGLLYNPNQASGKWQPSQLQPGQPLQKPEPLFRKLDESLVEEERARLGN